MDNIKDFSDERLKTWCIHCGRVLNRQTSSHDHVPSKVLLQAPLPLNLPVVQICQSCNENFSLDEEYFAAFLGAVLSGSTDPQKQALASAERILRRKCSLQKKIDKSKTVHRLPSGEMQTIWRPESARVDRVILKNARGHVFFELGEPVLGPPSRVLAQPLAVLTDSERFDFENVDLGPGWPEVGSRMLTRLVVGHDFHDGWVTVQEGVYRYAVSHADVLVVKSVLFEYLATEVTWSA